MLRSSLLAAALVATLVASPALVEAQEAQPTDDEAAALDDAHTLRDAGAGLTLGGIGLTGLGVGLMFGIGGFENWSGIIVGGLFEGLGGLAALIGIPSWIAGGVRSDVLSRPLAERAEVGWAYELAGIVTTLAGIGLCLVGGVLAGTGMGLESTWPRDERALEAMRSAGALVMIPLGYFVATFVGAPLWAEGARF